VPDDACLRDLSVKIGALTEAVANQKNVFERSDFKADRKFEDLSDKMIECIGICRSGHDRITNTEVTIKDHEGRIRKLEKAVGETDKIIGMTDRDKKWAVATIGTAWSGATIIIMELFRSLNWDIIKGMFH
jgi:hypothetical protein